MTIMHRAVAKSDNFYFEAYAIESEDAKEALHKGLLKHVEELAADPAWADDMMAQIRIHPVCAGESLFETFDLDIAGRTLVTSYRPDEKAEWRAYVEYNSARHGWGYVDGYGSSREDARVALAHGLEHAIRGESRKDIDMDAILLEAQTYPVRIDGAYRGGLVQGAGEPLLDDHLVPDLPQGHEKWLPTARIRLAVTQADGDIVETEAVARPTRDNHMPIMRFIHEDLAQAVEKLIKAIANQKTRTEVIRVMDERLADITVKGLLHRDEGAGEIIQIEGGSVLQISVALSETTPQSLVKVQKEL